ncbi:hypothetical protein F506_19805 [Herbaspirillum hiltneri N3]|uniref:DUF4238 domain-containing protein n=1 Tax=Herbaspirillum hiltneri N3 TaxID=1262470 RepID=A0ABN4I0C2_9BURK|nr:DUF4238 domain-containing protein [Herbaspirillum hiltneri]AKZ64598.1 hypothetical protein F506_19805 [Herbaspirillum hiltneri N3]
MDDRYVFFYRVENTIKELVAKKNRNPQKPVNQHFVPVTYQERFRGKDGALWAYIFKLGRIVNDAQPRKMGWISDLYTLPNEQGAPDYQVEHFFTVVEEMSTPAIKRVLNGDEITEEDRFWLCFFWGAAFCRSYDMIRSYQALFADLHKQELRSQVSSLEAAKRLLEDGPNDDGLTAEELFTYVHSDEYEIEYGSHSVLPAVLRLMPMICHFLWQSRITILLAPEGEPFVTGDSPVVLFPTHKRGQTGFKLSTRAMPLSSDVCLISTPRMSGVEKHMAPEEQVRAINLLIASSAHQFILGSSKDLISSLATATNAGQRVWKSLFQVSEDMGIRPR